jgi:hypothetical protein
MPGIFGSQEISTQNIARVSFENNRAQDITSRFRPTLASADVIYFMLKELQCSTASTRLARVLRRHGMIVVLVEGREWKESLDPQSGERRR